MVKVYYTAKECYGIINRSELHKLTFGLKYRIETNTHTEKKLAHTHTNRYSSNVHV